MMSYLVMKVWPFYGLRHWGGYLGSLWLMLLCVTLCPIINCPKTVKILVLKGLKGCGNELQPQKNQSNYHISDTIQLEIKRIKVYNSKQ